MHSIPQKVKPMVSIFFKSGNQIVLHFWCASKTVAIPGFRDANKVKETTPTRRTEISIRHRFATIYFFEWTTLTIFDTQGCCKKQKSPNLFK